MFNKNEFAKIIKNIKECYNSQEEFAKKSGIGRTYLSQYMNMKLDEPPKPKILEKLANTSNGIITYNELMEICGYIDSSVDTKLLPLYDELNNLEEEYHKAEQKLNAEEIEINDSLFYQLLDYLNDGYTNPKTFNPNELLDDFDFLSKKSKLKLCNSLKAKFDYYYKKQRIRESLTKKQEFENPSFNNKNFEIYMCPVYGQISAGQPNWVEENIEGRIPIDTNLMNIVNPEEHFFLRVNGESMNKVIKNGAFALIHKQDIVDDGEIAVILVNGYDATLKKFTRQGDMIILEPQSYDTNYKTQVYDKTTPIKILGKYVGKMEFN